MNPGSARMNFATPFQSFSFPDDYGCFGSDTPEQQRAHDAMHDEYEDGYEYWVEHGALVMVFAIVLPTPSPGSR